MAYLTPEEAEYIVRLARRSVEHFFRSGNILNEEPPYEKLRERAGAFTTIKRFPSGDLRGCIGYPEPIKPLHRAVIETAVLAATDDPRFVPMTEEELPHVTFEVSVLTPPEEIRAPPEERPRHVEVGKHGLIVRFGPYSGLLLPQVPVEYGWDAETFLAHTCLKAGLPPDCWMRGEVRLFRFSAEVYAEVEPGGRVVRIM